VHCSREGSDDHPVTTAPDAPAPRLAENDRRSND